MKEDKYPLYIRIKVYEVEFDDNDTQTKRQRLVDDITIDNRRLSKSQQTKEGDDNQHRSIPSGVEADFIPHIDHTVTDKVNYTELCQPSSERAMESSLEFIEMVVDIWRGEDVSTSDIDVGLDEGIDLSNAVSFEDFDLDVDYNEEDYETLGREIRDVPLDDGVDDDISSITRVCSNVGCAYCR